jgi:hypothetical protein
MKTDAGFGRGQNQNVVVMGVLTGEKLAKEHTEHHIFCLKGK